MTQLYKKCSTIKVHFLHHCLKWQSEDATDGTQQGERGDGCQEVPSPNCTADTEEHGYW